MILAAGEGRRLRPLTDRLPKCMLPIAGKPLLEYTIGWLARFGVQEIVINLHYLPDCVRGHFNDGSDWGVKISYSPEEHLLGTAGAVKSVAGFFDAPFFLWYGDNLSRCRLDLLYELHCRRQAMVTMALFRRDEVSQSGIVGLGQDQRIIRFLEKPAPHEVFSNWVNAGIFVMEPAILDFIPAGAESDFSLDILPALLAAGKKMCGYPLSREEGLWWIDRPEDLSRVESSIGL